MRRWWRSIRWSSPSDKKLIALDGKVSFDDNGLFKHDDVQQMRDLNEEEPLEIEAGENNLNYVKLDGNIGCMVNGAGLAMATMDVIKLAGSEPANFLDVGGGATKETVAAGFRILLKDPNVKGIFINIFGGIVRCERIAHGVIEAAKEVKITVPLVVRLQGTNADEGRKLLAGVRPQVGSRQRSVGSGAKNCEADGQSGSAPRLSSTQVQIEGLPRCGWGRRKKAEKVSILVKKNTRVVVQGIMRKAA